MQQIHCGGSSADYAVRLSCKVNSSWDFSTRQTVSLGLILGIRTHADKILRHPSLVVTCFSPSGIVGWCFQFEPRKRKQVMSRFRGAEPTHIMRSVELYLEMITASLLGTGVVKSCGDSSLLCDRRRRKLRTGAPDFWRLMATQYYPIRCGWNDFVCGCQVR